MYHVFCIMAIPVPDESVAQKGCCFRTGRAAARFAKGALRRDEKREFYRCGRRLSARHMMMKESTLDTPKGLTWVNFFGRPLDSLRSSRHNGTQLLTGESTLCDLLSKSQWPTLALTCRWILTWMKFACSHLMLTSIKTAQ